MNELENLNYCEETIRLQKYIQENFIELGVRLLRIRNEELWKGGTYGDWIGFLSQAKFSESSASKLMTIVEYLLNQRGIEKDKILAIGDWSNAYELAQVARRLKMPQEELNTLIDKSILLSRKDLKTELTELKTGIPQADCQHTDTYDVEICKECGRRVRIYDEEND